MRANKRVLAAMVAALTVFGLSACGGTESTATPTVTATVTQDAPEVSSAEAEDAYWLAVSGRSSFARSAGKQTTVELGNTICAALDQGAAVKEILLTGLESGVPAESVAAVLAGSVVFLCPEHQARVTVELDALSSSNA